MWYILIIVLTAGLIYFVSWLSGGDILSIIGAAAVGVIAYVVVWFKRRKRVSK